jgi:hypothetical protein
MGEKERPNPGHGGRTNPTRRRMKALKSTFTAPGAALYRTSAERRTTGNAPARSSDQVGWRLRTDDGGHRSDPMTPAHGFRRRICPEVSASSPPRSKLGQRWRAFGLPTCGRARSWPISARNSDGGPGLDREPTATEGASPRERGSWNEREEHEREGSARAELERGWVGIARAASGPPYVSVSELLRRVTGSTRWIRRRKPPDLPHSSRVTRGARRVSARAPAAMRGPRRGASSDPVGGRPPDPGWKRRRGPSRMRPPAMRSASSARRRSEPPALTSHGRTSTTGRRCPPPSDAAQRHERPPSPAGKPDGGEPIPTTPPAEVERVERGRDDRGEHGASARPRETA